VSEPDVATITRDLRAALGRLNRRLRAQDTLSDLGHLTRSQALVLSRLENEGPATTSTLARAAGMRPQSMSAIVAALVEGGYVEGRPDPADGRKTLLSVTAHAREQFAAGRLARDDWLSQAARTRLTPAEQAELQHCTELLNRLAD
jgi:DNA-binding MarR family transcriptional regulator